MTKQTIRFPDVSKTIELDWKSDLLNKLEEPESNFSDKNRWIVDWVEGLLSLQKEHDARVAERKQKTYPLLMIQGQEIGLNAYNQACTEIAKSIREQEL